MHWQEVSVKGACQDFTYLWSVLTSASCASEALDELNLNRYCCRRMVLIHVDLIEKLLQYSSTSAVLLLNLRLNCTQMLKNREIRWAYNVPLHLFMRFLYAQMYYTHITVILPLPLACRPKCADLNAVKICAYRLISLSSRLENIYYREE